MRTSKFAGAALFAALLFASSADAQQTINGGTIKAGTVSDTQLATANKPSVGMVATANLTLSGAQTIDGQLGTAGTTLVLATAQSTGAQNGPWIMQSGAWTRPAWYPAGGTTQAQQFAEIHVRLGTVYQGSVWRITTAAPVTIDTTATTWAVTPLALNTNTVAGQIAVGTLPNITCALLPAFIGDILSSAGSCTTAIAAAAVTLAKMANLGANTIIGSVAGGTPAALTPTQVTAMLNVATSSLQGLVPASGGGSTNFLRSDFTWTAAGSSNVFPFGGDGSDGTVLMDGTNTFAAFASKASLVYTLTRDVYATTLTVNNTVTLVTAGYRIFATVLVSNAGTITAAGGAGNPGQAGSGAAGGVGAAAGYNAGGTNGGSGNTTGAVGTAISAAKPGAGGAGGAGGTGNGGAQAGGAGGTLAAPTVAQGSVRNASTMVNQFVLTTAQTGTAILSGGAGGGSAGGGGTSSGGTGGGGGGVVGIYAATLTNTGTITAAGGIGGAGTVTNAGGGGGGGGGAIFILTGATVTNSGTISAPAGSGGALNGTGVAGSAGSAGVVIQLVV